MTTLMFCTFLRYWFPTLCWMAVIFIGSADSHSFQHANSIFGTVLLWLFPHLTPGALEKMVLVCRKCSHLAEYAILAALLWRAYVAHACKPDQSWSWPVVAWTLLSVVAYASSDEYHQTFVPTREGTLIDVVIDTCGAAVGLLIIWALQKYWKLRLRRQPGTANVQGRVA